MPNTARVQREFECKAQCSRRESERELRLELRSLELHKERGAANGVKVKLSGNYVRESSLHKCRLRHAHTCTQYLEGTLRKLHSCGIPEVHRTPTPTANWFRLWQLLFCLISILNLRYKSNRAFAVNYRVNNTNVMSLFCSLSISRMLPAIQLRCLRSSRHTRARSTHL